MSLVTWKLMLPALKKAMSKKAGFTVAECLFYMDNGEETIFCILSRENSLEKYKGEVDPDSMFAQMLLDAKKTIEGDWSRSTLLIDFKTKNATNQIYKKNESGDLSLVSQTIY